MSIEHRTEPRLLLADLAFPESPRWRDGRLWVSDWGAGEVVTVGPDGVREVVARVPGLMCIDHTPDGRLLAVDNAERRLVRREIDGSLVTHAELGGHGEHPWNDIVIDGRGNAYVNNIGFDFPEGPFAPGFVALVGEGDGAVRVVADDLAFPNGMAVTPDGGTLIVAESYGQRLTAFSIGPDGSLSGRRTWAEVEDHPDGICLDAEGAVWYADVGSRRCVRVREGGEVLDVVEVDRGCFACVLGGPERRTLFVVANEWGGPESFGTGGRMGQVLAFEAPVPGAGWP
jgi:sugar lactone lactonase YvrE